MNRINIYQLMTWQRKYPKIFPYGLSILPSIFSNLLVLIPSILFIYCLIHKQKYQFIGFLILSNISVYLFMYKCVSTNPGIIPQIITNRQRDSQLINIPTAKYIDDDKKYIIPNRNLFLYSKYCYQCKIYRPPRSIHCNYCNHCVQKYDHHCPWLSVCIGKFNYIYFLGYISSIILVGLYTFGVCFSIVYQQINQQKHISSFILQILIGCFSIFFGIAVLRLLIFHLIIIYNKKTTNQDLKKTYPNIINLPYNHLYLNDRQPLFTPETQYYMDKNYNRSSSKNIEIKKSDINFKQIMLTNLNRQLNDSTSSSSSVVIQAHRFSITATQRTSILNYLLESQSQ